MTHLNSSPSDAGRSHDGAALVVSGGDGAIYYALQKLRPPYPTLAIRPAGRGNSLARDLRELGGTVAIDLMEVEVEPAGAEPYTRLCASTIGFGYPATLARASLHFRPLRRFSYFAAAIITIPKAEPLQIQYDNGMFETKTLTGVLINNIRHAGGFVALPKASCRDGRVESMELHSGFLGQMAHNLSSMSRADLYTPARITTVSQATIRPSHPQELTLDGELLPNIAAIRMRVLPAAISCYFLEP